jgi:hypothetical protein
VVNNPPQSKPGGSTILGTGGVDSEELQIEVFPVPNNGDFTAAITSSVPETFTIAIYNAIGQRIYELKDIPVQGRTEREIDLRPIPEGLYMVVFENKQKTITKRILVQR